MTEEVATETNHTEHAHTAMHALPAERHAHAAAEDAEQITLEIPLRDLVCTCCDGDIVETLRHLPHVSDVRVDADRKVAHIGVHPGVTDAATARSSRTAASSTRFRCPRSR